MPTLADLRKQLPEYNGVSDDFMFNDVHKKYFPNADKYELANEFDFSPTEEHGDFVRGVLDTGTQLKQAGQGIGAAAGAAIESSFGEGGIGTTIKNKSLDAYRETGKDLQETGKQSDSFTYAKAKFEAGDAGYLADWAQYAVGQGIAQLASAFATGGLGSAAAKVVAPKLTQRLITDETRRLVAGGIAADVAEAEATKTITAKLGSIGANTAIGVSAFGQEGGEIGGGLVDQADGKPLTGEQHATALLDTALAGGLEFAQDKFGLKLIEGKALGKTTDLTGAKGMFSRAAIAGTAGAFGEGVTENVQTRLEEAGKGNDPFSSATNRMAIDATAAAGLTGGGAGVAGGMLHVPKLPDVTPVLDPNTSVEESISAAQEIINEPPPTIAEQAGMDARQKALDLVASTRQKQIDRISGRRTALEAGETARQQMLGLIDQQKQAGTNGLAALGQLIGKGEGSYTSINKGTHNGKILASGTNDGLINMTIGQIKALQQQHVDAQNSGQPGQGLFAVGKYQFIPETFKRAASKAGLKDNDLFSPLNQERMFEANLPNKVKQFLVGQTDNIDEAIEALSHEWASIPSISKNGMSFYGDGNKSSHSIESVRQALLAARNGGAISAITPELSATAKQALDENQQETGGILKTIGVNSNEKPVVAPLDTKSESPQQATQEVTPSISDESKPKIQPVSNEITDTAASGQGATNKEVGAIDSEPLLTKAVKNENDKGTTGKELDTSVNRNPVRRKSAKPLSSDDRTGIDRENDIRLDGANTATDQPNSGLSSTQFELPLENDQPPSLANRDNDLKLLHEQWKTDNPTKTRPGLSNTRKVAKIADQERYDAQLSEDEFTQLHGKDSLPKQKEWQKKYGVKPKSLPGNEIDTKANEAATSPNNNIPQPTQAQKEAGNYKKGKINLHGLNISIENPKGSVRSGVNKAGKKWENTLQHHYGYIRGTKSNDGEQVDVFIGDKPESQSVYVINQNDPETGKFDEHKAILGVTSKQDAIDAYHANYEKGWQGMGSIAEMSIDEFKEKISNGAITQPIKSRGEKTKAKTQIEPEPLKTDDEHTELYKQVINKRNVGEMVAEIRKKIAALENLKECVNG